MNINMKKLFTIVYLLTYILGANADEVVDVEIDYTTVTSDAWNGGWRSESAAERVSVIPGKGIYFLSEEATDPFYDVQFQLPGIKQGELDSDASYTITIKIKGSVEQSIKGYFSGSDESVDIPIANDWQTLSFSGCQDNPNANYFASSGSLLLQCGNYVGDWMISYIKISHEEGGDSQKPKCATPEISYANGMITFNCETEGVEYISDIKSEDVKKYNVGEITLTQKYNVSVYATKDGYNNSDIATREIVITGNGKAIVVGDVDGNGKVNVADHVMLSDIIMNQ